MITDKPPVIIIRVKDNPTSEKLAEKTQSSWERLGYVTEFFDAVTPNDFDKYNYLDFGNEILPHKTEYKTKESLDLLKDDELYDRVISDTAKAVYYSHIEVWKLISERKAPHIVVDHDMTLTYDLPTFKVRDFEFYQFGETTTHASYFTPFIVDKVLERLEKHGLVGELKIGEGVYQNRLVNVDGYLWGVLLNVVVDDKSLVDKLRFFVDDDILCHLRHIEKSNHRFYNSRDNCILDISKTREMIYVTVDHEKLKVSYPSYKL